MAVPDEIIKVAHQLDVAKRRVNHEADVAWETTRAMQNLVDAWNLVAALRGWPTVPL